MDGPGDDTGDPLVPATITGIADVFTQAMALVVALQTPMATGTPPQTLQGADVPVALRVAPVCGT